MFHLCPAKGRALRILLGLSCPRLMESTQHRFLPFPFSLRAALHWKIVLHRAHKRAGVSPPTWLGQEHGSVLSPTLSCSGEPQRCVLMDGSGGQLQDRPLLKDKMDQ